MSGVDVLVRWDGSALGITGWGWLVVVLVVWAIRYRGGES